MSRPASLCTTAAVVCVLTASCSGLPSVPVPPRTTAVSFATLVRNLTRLPLASNTVGSLVAPAGALATGRHVVVLDWKRAEMRLYARADGALEGVIGTPGDGEGQLRKPEAIAALDSGQFVVLDDGRRLLSFRDSLGGVLRETRLPEGSFTSLVAIPAERRIVLAGQIFYGPDSIRQKDLHEFDYHGRLVASYGDKAASPTLWSRAYGTTMVASAGAELLTATLASNQVRFLDRRTRAVRWTDVAPRWYTPLEWPSDRLLQHGTTQQTATMRVTEWTRQHRLMNGLFSLSGDRLLARFQAFDPSGSRFYYYALGDRTTGRYVVTHPTRVNVLSVSGDTLFWIDGGGKRAASLVTAVVSGDGTTSMRVSSGPR